MKYKNLSQGQTLLELIISIGVVVFVMLGLVVAVTSSLRFGQSSRSRSRAVKYAQEAVEITRQLRDVNTWDTFFAYTGASTKTWCLNKDGAWYVDGSPSCDILDGIFSRLVTLTWQDPIVHVQVNVSWQEGDHVSHSTLETYLTEWK